MVMKINTQQEPNKSQLFLFLLFLSSTEYNGKNVVRFYNLELSYFFSFCCPRSVSKGFLLAINLLKCTWPDSLQVQQELGIAVETTSFWAVLGTFAISIFATDICATTIFVTFSPHN